MRAGKLRHRVVIQEIVGTRSNYGEELQTWKNVVTLWASVQPQRGAEKYESAQDVPNYSVKIRCRYYSGIDEKMRVSWGGKYYNIQAIIVVNEIKHEMILLCEEGSNDG
jgi:SPP1 family predicted phage head-tail adaptor